MFAVATEQRFFHLFAQKVEILGALITHTNSRRLLALEIVVVFLNNILKQNQSEYGSLPASGYIPFFVVVVTDVRGKA